jgi:hypothetical protein
MAHLVTTQQDEAFRPAPAEHVACKISRIDAFFALAAMSGNDARDEMGICRGACA